jgi:sterol desaturase/sphingolipid hydroxylase (fatty acid hydroxylase superfamily)
MGWFLQWLDLPRTLLLAAIFVPLERLLSLHRRPWLRIGLATDLAYMLIGMHFIRIGFVLVFLSAFAFRNAMVPVMILEWVRSQPLWLQFVEVVVISDLCFYWVHRLFHRVPALWRFHAVHHSIEKMDWVAGHRVHPVDQVLTKGVGYLLVISIGFSEWAMVAAAFVYGWHSVLLHSNVKLPLQIIEGFIATPAFHHWHHSNERNAWDRNFAGQISFLDRLFGTAYMPKNETPGCYGVDDPVPKTFLGQLAYPFSRLGAFAAPAVEHAPSGAGPPEQSGL